MAPTLLAAALLLVSGAVLASVYWTRRLNNEIDGLMFELDIADEIISDLNEQLAPFDHDGDGRVGGSRPKSQ